jgi:hypothetical protein
MRMGGAEPGGDVAWLQATAQRLDGIHYGARLRQGLLRSLRAGAQPLYNHSHFQLEAFSILFPCSDILDRDLRASLSSLSGTPFMI